MGRQTLAPHAASGSPWRRGERQRCGAVVCVSCEAEAWRCRGSRARRLARGVTAYAPACRSPRRAWRDPRPPPPALLDHPPRRHPSLPPRRALPGNRFRASSEPCAPGRAPQVTGAPAGGPRDAAVSPADARLPLGSPPAVASVGGPGPAGVVRRSASPPGFRPGVASHARVAQRERVCGPRVGGGGRAGFSVSPAGGAGLATAGRLSPRPSRPRPPLLPPAPRSSLATHARGGADRSPGGRGARPLPAGPRAPAGACPPFSRSAPAGLVRPPRPDPVPPSPMPGRLLRARPGVSFGGPGSRVARPASGAVSGSRSRRLGALARFLRLASPPRFRDATSDQTWRPAEFKHISQRRKRN